MQWNEFFKTILCSIKIREKVRQKQKGPNQQNNNLKPELRLYTSMGKPLLIGGSALDR